MDDARKRIAEVMRHDRGRILAALVGNLRDVDLAEEALSEAVESAVCDWSRNGPPDRPRAWLIQVARRKAIDRIRRHGRFADRLPELEILARADQEAANGDPPEIPDERLALIFACCHPALGAKSRIALTLRTVCRLPTEDIAHFFLDTEATMAQRLSRAKAKLRKAGVGFEVPGAEMWHERLDSVLTVIYLVYNKCYSAPDPTDPRSADLCNEAMYLSKLVFGMLPEDDEARGLLALLQLIDSRRAARAAPDGTAVPLESQDAGLWDHDGMAAGFELLAGLRPPQENGFYALQARIQAEHMRYGPGGTRWGAVLAIYDLMWARMPTPVVACNRAVPLAKVAGVPEALDEIESLAEELADYPPYHAVRANLLAEAGQVGPAREAYDRAIRLSISAADVQFLTARRDRLSG